jgi:hypothetical protein
MTIADVSSVLNGTWSRTRVKRGACVYRSDRGAVFAISPSDVPPAEEAAALADARIHNCDGAKPRDVPNTGGAYVCIERPSRGDLVVGNIIAKGYYWMLVMVGQGSDPTYSAQSNAMAELLRAVRR